MTLSKLNLGRFDSKNIYEDTPGLLYFFIGEIKKKGEIRKGLPSA